MHWKWLGERARKDDDRGVRARRAARMRVLVVVGVRTTAVLYKVGRARDRDYAAGVPGAADCAV